MQGKRSAIPPPVANGTRFGRLTVVGVSEKKDRRGRIYRCRCDCGTVKDVAGWVLKRGDTRSCGCLKRELAAVRGVAWATTHGLSKHRSYGAWKGMHQRCENPKNPKYRIYGARGIRVCERWSGPYGFAHFLSDMGERPEGKSLDRIDNDGNYEPSNCRWATPGEQMANRRVATLTYDQVRQIRAEFERGWTTQTALAERWGVSKTVMSQLIRRKTYADA